MNANYVREDSDVSLYDDDDDDDGGPVAEWSLDDAGKWFEHYNNAGPGYGPHDRKDGGAFDDAYDDWLQYTLLPANIERIEAALEAEGWSISGASNVSLSIYFENESLLEELSIEAREDEDEDEDEWGELPRIRVSDHADVSSRSSGGSINILMQGSKALGAGRGLLVIVPPEPLTQGAAEAFAQEAIDLAVKQFWLNEEQLALL